MQAATTITKEKEKERDKDKQRDTSPLPTASNLQQSSLLSSSQDPSLSSYATIRSSIGNILPQKVADKKKKGRKKLMTAADQLSDEAKSAEYKAFEAFLMGNHSHQGMDELDLTGQEDPVILHAIIANLPSQQAYKEVHKFRRRPQYLEFLVHLSNLTLAKGSQERVMGWLQEAFQWLKKRNTLLLTPKPPQPKAGGGTHAHQKTQAISTRGSATALAQAKGGRHTSQTALVPTTAKGQNVGTKDSKVALSASKEEQSGKGGTSKALLVQASQQKTQQIVRKSSAMGKRLVPAASRSLDVSLSVKITRDDIEFKAHSLVATLLPDLWRKHKCRKRLRAVCCEDMPWRSQANLIQAVCYLDQLLGRLGNNSETTVDVEPQVHQPSGLTFDVAGVIIDGVLPTHPPAIAGVGRKVNSTLK